MMKKLTIILMVLSVLGILAAGCQPAADTGAGGEPKAGEAGGAAGGTEEGK